MQGKTALVLSAGGMFGAYQAGAWKTIERHLQPDMVIGASVGALNGWCIAGGCSGEELARQWLDPDTASLLKLRPNAGVRNGFFESHALERKAEWLHAAYTPRVPFGLVVVQLPWLKTKLIRGADVQPGHLVATCSILFFLPSVEIGGRKFTDGGLLEALPIWAAAEMGASRIVAVHSLPSVAPWWIRAGLHTLRGIKRRPIAPSNLQITTIAPSEAMGTARDALSWKAGNIQRWIDLGERDAARHFPLQ
ncbi:MAG: patatin-like phospholipase family protein [Acidobacteriota bacterium]|nr:patatin-like phospholipase family protein [Acidobacteriota bacterium]